MKEFNFEKELLGVQDELFRFAYKLTANREKAEDLLQDTLLKAMLHKESYNKNTNFKGWLFIIMRNTFINGYRAEVGHTRLYISSDPAYYSRIMDGSCREEVDKNYDLEKIRNAIKSVPEVMSEKVCKILLVLSPMLGVPQAWGKFVMLISLCHFT